MTGEMSWIKANGDSADGNSYPVHALVARALRSPLRPFDTYIGPYIAHKRGKLFISIGDDGVSGIACLWIGGIAPAYLPAISTEFFPFNDANAAIEAARTVIKLARKS